MHFCCPALWGRGCPTPVSQLRGPHQDLPSTLLLWGRTRLCLVLGARHGERKAGAWESVGQGRATDGLPGGHRCVWSHTEQKLLLQSLKCLQMRGSCWYHARGWVSACLCPSGTPWRPCKGGEQHPGESSTPCCAGASSDGEVWAAPAHLCVRKTKIQTGDFLWGGAEHRSISLSAVKPKGHLENFCAFVRKEADFSLPGAPWGLPHRFPASERANSLRPPRLALRLPLAPQGR